MSSPDEPLERAAARSALEITRVANGRLRSSPPSALRPIRGSAAPLPGTGVPLPQSARLELESEFGLDLGAVRVHVDEAARLAAQELRADAFTVGSHIYFGAERYAPDAPDGRKLLAHEVTHVVQQQGSTAGPGAGGEAGASSAVVARQQVCDPSITSCPPNPDSDDYQAGYADAITTGVSHAVPRFGQALTDYDTGFAAGSARRSSPTPSAVSLVPDTSGTYRPNPDSPDYRAGYDDATVGSGEPGAGARTDQARGDYDAGYAAGLKVAQQPSETRAPQATVDNTASLPLTERVKKTIEYAGEELGPEAFERLKELLSPEALAILAAFIAAQFVGLGEIADAVGLAALALKIGTDAVTVADDLSTCFVKTYSATSDRDLRTAGNRLAHAITLAGVDILLAYLATKGAKGKAAGEGEGAAAEAESAAGKQEGKATSEGGGEGARRGQEKVSSEPVEGPAEGITAEDVHLADERTGPSVKDPEMTPAICFAAGTPVHAPAGTQPIEAIRAGDLVLAWDEQARVVTPRRVTDLVRGATATWVDIELVGPALLRSTPAHRFWVESVAGWVAAGALTPGMTVRLVDGRTTEVRAARRATVDSEATFNLTVEGLETFFVGGAGVLVHNITQSRYTRLNRAGYSNYLLREGGPRGRVYYSGIFGPDETAAGVARRHAANNNRFDPAQDYIDVQPGTRTYGEARVVENDLANQYDTVIGREGGNYRGNRQQPLADEKLSEYEEFLDIKAQGNCG